MTTNYTSLYELDELSFIAGTQKTLSFTVYKEDGVTELDISCGTVNWYLSYPFQETEAVIEKEGEITGDHTFTIAITSADTIDLNGKYIQEIVLTDISGNSFRVAKGNIFIIPSMQQ